MRPANRVKQSRTDDPASPRGPGSPAPIRRRQRPWASHCTCPTGRAPGRPLTNRITARRQAYNSIQSLTPRRQTPGAPSRYVEQESTTRTHHEQITCRISRPCDFGQPYGLCGCTPSGGLYWPPRGLGRPAAAARRSVSRLPSLSRLPGALLWPSAPPRPLLGSSLRTHALPGSRPAEAWPMRLRGRLRIVADRIGFPIPGARRPHEAMLVEWTGHAAKH